MMALALLTLIRPLEFSREPSPVWLAQKAAADCIKARRVEAAREIVRAKNVIEHCETR